MNGFIKRLRYVLLGVEIEENAKLLKSIEELIMSAITPVIDQIQAKATALKAANDALTAAAVQNAADMAAVQQQLADVKNQLAAAIQNAVDPADVQKLNDILAILN